MFSKFFVFIALFANINADNSEVFELNLTPPTLTMESTTKCFHCNESDLIGIYAVHSDVQNISCNSVRFDHKVLIFNITYLNYTDVLVTNNAPSYLINLNGNSISLIRGRIVTGVCAGGNFQLLEFYVADDHNGCALDSGLDRKVSVYASIRIEKGACHSYCEGASTLTYEPSISNFN